VDPLARVFLILVVGFGVLQVLGRALKKRHSFPAPAAMGRLLDSPLRKLVQPPTGVVARSGLAEGMQVLEIGCGSGAFTICAANAVRPRGKVYALDLQRRMLKHLCRKLRRRENRGLGNVVPVRAGAVDLPFADRSFDAAFMVTVLQEIPDRSRALEEVRRVLRPGGTLAVTEFLPDPDYPLRSTTVALCAQAGFSPDTVEGSFWNYTARFTTPQDTPDAPAGGRLDVEC
jgi:ubiquinone/menaquinone biosynthesis C-methylase UbiE